MENPTRGALRGPGDDTQPQGSSTGLPTGTESTASQGHGRRPGRRDEIADQPFVSVHTVKAPVTSIYRKLAVSSRTQAIDRGRSLGLLPAPSQSPSERARDLARERASGPTRG